MKQFYQLLTLATLAALVGVGFPALKTFNYTQKLDHFDFVNNLTFQQRYVIDDTNWAGADTYAPIFVYFGGEGPIDQLLGFIGLFDQSLPQFRALALYIEHRFYGKSIPYGSIEKAMLDPEVRGCLSSAQALADFAEIILSVKASLSATNSPVIVLGGSYSGMLAAWFRLKYPNIAIGALASSAPLLYLDSIPLEDSFCSVVGKDFKDISESCYEAIRQSWDVIDEIASQPNGLNLLSHTFNLCRVLNSPEELKSFLVQMYTFAAQYDSRFHGQTSRVCNAIVNGGTNVIAGISRAVFALFPQTGCYDLSALHFGPPGMVLDTNSTVAWNWQLCSELMIPYTCGNNMIFPPWKFNISQYMEGCKLQYGVSPRPNWVSTYYYGRNDIKLALKDSASNIILSNGLRDPYSSAGILEDVSETIVAITTKEGSHCMDLSKPKDDDPKWLKHQREKEIMILAKWINYAQNSSGSCLIKHHHRSSPVLLLWVLLTIVVHALFL